jgi:hypothetical protein
MILLRRRIHASGKNRLRHTKRRANQGTFGAAFSSLHERGRERLTDMSSGVFGGMKQQTEHSSRETGAADFAIVEQRVARRRPQLVHRGIDCAADGSYECG